MRAGCTLAAAILLFLTALQPAAAVERILRFVSDVQVERNGDLVVTETIRVQAEGREIRRGILRDFPTSYRGRDGRWVQIGFEVQSVARDGQTESWTTERRSNGVSVRIGSADRTLNTGEHEYVIRYRTTRQIGFFANYDELYWNVTGNGWTFTIDVAEARIRLPEAVPFGQTAFYTGPQGATGKDATIVEQRPGFIVFRTTRPLPRQNGLTVAASWQKGLVEPPSQSQQAEYWLTDNVAVPIALGGLALLIVFYGVVWLTVGRDPARGTIIPLFGPPTGMSAAAVRYVDRLGFDQRCFTAAIIDLGVNGQLKIVGGGDDKPVMEKRAGGKPVPPGEQAVIRKLFASKPSLLIDQVNHERFGAAKDALDWELSKAYRGKLFRTNIGWAVVGTIAGAVLLLAIAVAVAQTYAHDEAAAFLLGMLVPLPFIMAGSAMIFRGLQRDRNGLTIGGLAIGGIPAVCGFAFMWINSVGWVDLVPAVAAFVVAALLGMGFRWLQAPSVEGRRVMDQIDGFRQYLGVAEEDRLNALNPPEKTPELFERFLPYALALDVENRWAERFTAVLAAAGATAAVTSWYAGNTQWGSDPVAFANNLGGSLNASIASASTPPGSSGGSDSGGGGSSGGGSSGGGGGGGGGSGW
jgi:uncharacterized membrane protein YgcG